MAEPRIFMMLRLVLLVCMVFISSLVGCTQDAPIPEYTPTKGQELNAVVVASPSGSGVPGIVEVVRYDLSTDFPDACTVISMSFLLVGNHLERINGIVTLCDGNNTVIAGPKKLELIYSESSFLDKAMGSLLSKQVITGEVELGSFTFTKAMKVIVKVDTTGASVMEHDSIRMDLIDVSYIGPNGLHFRKKWMMVTGGTIVY